MKKYHPTFICLLITLLFLPGCDLIEDIFEFGFWTILIIIVAVIALIIWGLSSFSSSNQRIPDAKTKS